MQLNRIHHAAIICSNYEQSKTFYTEILKLRVIAENLRANRSSYKLDLALPDGSQIELFSFPNPPARLTRPEALGLRHLAFSTPDIDECVVDLRRHEISVEDIRVDEYTGKRFTFFCDPDGLPLELYEDKRMNQQDIDASTDYFLRSDRLGFRCWAEDDLNLALGLWGDSAVTEWIGGPFSTEKVKERLSKERAQMVSSCVQYWPLFLLDNGEHVGCAGLRPYDAANHVYELGFHIRSKYWRQGFALEAAGAVIEYAFNNLSARGLFAGHNPKNLASAQLLRKLGFKYIRDEYYAPTGLQHPSYMLSASEYANL